LIQLVFNFQLLNYPSLVVVVLVVVHVELVVVVVRLARVVGMGNG
jgi:hypothetical protein